MLALLLLIGCSLCGLGDKPTPTPDVAPAVDIAPAKPAPAPSLPSPGGPRGANTEDLDPNRARLARPDALLPEGCSGIPATFEVAVKADLNADGKEDRVATNKIGCSGDVCTSFVYLACDPAGFRQVGKFAVAGAISVGSTTSEGLSDLVTADGDFRYNGEFYER